MTAGGVDPSRFQKITHGFVRGAKNIGKKIKQLKPSSKEKVSKQLSADKPLQEVMTQQICAKKGDTHVGKLHRDITEIVENWDTLEGQLEAEVGKLKGTKKINAQARLAELKEMVAYAKVLQADSFSNDAINKLANYRLEMKKEGISDAFPKSMVKENPNYKGFIQDENGKDFDHLRDQVTDRFSEFCEKRGGNYRLIKYWFLQQGASSSSPESNKVKQIITHFRNPPEETRWYESKTFQPPSYIESEFEDTLLMFMAFNMEFLTHTDLPGKNEENGTITIYRTDNITRLEKEHGGELEKGQTYSMKRNVFSSGSILEPVAICGAGEVTKQEVPFHRIIGTYLTERINFEEEKEFLCMLDGIPFTYEGTWDKFHGYW